MAAGESLRVALEREPDPLTGRLVERLTPPDSHGWMPYFNQSLFVDGRLLVHSTASGSTQAWLLDPETGEMIQLTDEPGGLSAHASTLLPGRRALAVIAGNRILRVDLDGLSVTPLFEVTSGYNPSILSPSGDGSAVTFAVSEKLETVTRIEGQQYSDFIERLYRRPSSLIFRVDTTTGTARAIWGEREWISHVLVSPVDDNLVVFCHEGPWDRVQRLWLLEVATGAVRPILEEPRHRTRCGHELFAPDGRLVVQYSRRLTTTARDWLHYDCVTDPYGHDPRFWRFPAGMPMHVSIAWGDDTLLCGDRAYPEEGFDGGRWIALIRHEPTERCAVTPLCRHDTSFQTQRSHPHPVFSPDDRWVYFNTDAGGTNTVRRVAVDQ